MVQFRALIFDMDGVIIDTEALHAEAKRLTFERYGIAVPERLYTEFRGRSDLDMVEHVVRELAGGALSPAEVVGAKHDVFRTLHEKIAPVEGALEFIRLARRRFERLALATSATRANQEFAFEKFALRPFFDVVVTSEDIGRTKPHPDPYLKAAEKLGMSPGACLVIEDSTNGVLSARAAGCAVAAITTSFSRDELKDARADMMVDSFPELASLLAIDAGGAA
ncbi:HAD family hydrolase [Sorangium cellulosum]|uniref:HAD family hydrolase n=1 Tax=Sorangium cellulosum TaxID=56 RepID=UPI003D9A660A